MASTFLDSLKLGLDRLGRAIAKPRVAIARRGTVVLQPYRGYGSRREIFLMGRVFRERRRRSAVVEGLRHKLSRLWTLFRRWGVAKARLAIRFEGKVKEVLTDEDGYFRVRMELDNPCPEDRRWHAVTIELLEPIVLRTTADIFIPPDDCRFVVISDIDDTVMETGVANKLRMMWRLFVEPAESRVAFPGMAAFLRALHRGPTGDGANILLYVSRAPWGIYGVLEAFFRLHAIPVGPILFLREWGLTLQSPLPRRTKSHKLDLIQDMLSLYQDLPFILIGDSGQSDPEIYTRIVHAHPNRVLCVYIRNVSDGEGRMQAVDALAAEIRAAGSRFMLASDTVEMARHAAEIGLIAEEALSDLRDERAHQGRPAASSLASAQRTAP